MHSSLSKPLAFGLALTACASVNASKRKPAVIANGSFTPALAASPNYGPDPTRVCSNAVATAAGDTLAKSPPAPGHPAAQADGRLCAAAETLLSWDGETAPPNLTSFVSWYFGLVAPVTQVTIATFQSNDESQIGERLAETVQKSLGTMPNLRYGIAAMAVDAKNAADSTKTRVERLAQASGATKIVLLVQDGSLQIDPLPRKLAANSAATLSGRVQGDFQNLQLLVSDPQGKLETQKLDGAQPFKREIKCGDKPGQARVEVRGEMAGKLMSLANFPIACGGDLPTSVEVAAAGPAGPAPAGADLSDRAMLEQINSERTGAGLKALQWDDDITAVAKSLADAAAQGGSLSSEQIVAALKQRDINSSVILLNPANARTTGEAAQEFAASAVNRSNYMNKDVTHAGIGVARAKDKGGKESVFVAELFVQKAGKIDASSTQQQIRKAIAEKRAAAGVPPIADDHTLTEVAQKYAKALAESDGKLSREKGDALIRPLYKSFSKVDFISGQTQDPAAFANDPSMLSKTKLLGIGIAQSKSGVFAVFIFANRK